MDNKRIFAILRKAVFTLIILLVVGFIFYNSSQIGSASGAFSQTATTWLNGILGRLGIDYQLSHLAVRKLGHLAEFCLLGFWLMLGLRVYTRRTVAFVAWPLLIGLGIAVCDEFLQAFVPGRTSSVTDVAIDFAGVVLGLCVAAVFMAIVGAIWRHLRRPKAETPPKAKAPRKTARQKAPKAVRSAPEALWDAPAQNAPANRIVTAGNSTLFPGPKPPEPAPSFSKPDTAVSPPSTTPNDTKPPHRYSGRPTPSPGGVSASR